MYIHSITIENFRTFRNAKIDFVYAGRDAIRSLPTPKLPNINLLLGNNGSGKTTLLKAIALAALGPSVGDAGIFPYRLVRREPQPNDEDTILEDKTVERFARIIAKFVAHRQDESPYNQIDSAISVALRGDLERLRWTHKDEKAWHPIYSSNSDAFFFVGYGATRRVEQRESTNISTRNQNSFARAQRIQSLFEETYSLLPFSAWLPIIKQNNPQRFQEIKRLVNKMMGRYHFHFTGEMENSEYVFEKRGLRVPFPALSDGYRAYLGWIGDLLYHITMTTPQDVLLIDNQGIVMIDEIDLHIHPKWQINLLPNLAKALPNIQFIVTSHSPLVTGSLEWMNIIQMAYDTKQASRLRRRKTNIHGLDADQILLSDYFGMSSTRVQAKKSQLDRLTERARAGDSDAAQALLDAMSEGLEL